MANTKRITWYEKKFLESEESSFIKGALKLKEKQSFDGLEVINVSNELFKCLLASLIVGIHTLTKNQLLAITVKSVFDEWKDSRPSKRLDCEMINLETESTKKFLRNFARKMDVSIFIWISTNLFYHFGNKNEDRRIVNVCQFDQHYVALIP